MLFVSVAGEGGLVVSWCGEGREGGGGGGKGREGMGDKVDGEGNADRKGGEGQTYGCGLGLEEEGGVVQPGLRGREVWHFAGWVVTLRVGRWGVCLC